MFGSMTGRGRTMNRSGRIGGPQNRRKPPRSLTRGARARGRHLGRSLTQMRRGRVGDIVSKGSSVPQLSALLCPFSGWEGSTTGKSWYPYSNLSTGGPRRLNGKPKPFLEPTDRHPFGRPWQSRDGLHFRSGKRPCSGAPSTNRIRVNPKLYGHPPR